jgi:L-2,4-diaminobutyric acid acetyltransferase
MRYSSFPEEIYEAHMPSHSLRSSKQNDPVVSYRVPASEDGEAVWELIRSCGPLDDNSLYCNLLQCDHFADTCVIARVDGKVAGWVSAYVLPSTPATLFVWQVAVAESARGMGLAGRMLDHLIGREACEGVENVNTTITADNAASWALFRSFARRMEAPIEGAPHFTRQDHFGGKHATEIMAQIGPFGALSRRKAA